MHVGIHQPNYFPWLGYFYKILSSQAFIFLDDVQYSKNSYINRTKIYNNQKSRWLSIPVSFNFGDAICETYPAQDNWQRSHIDLLLNYYRNATHFKSVMPIIEDMLNSTSSGALSEINITLIEKMTSLLNIDCAFSRSSQISVTANTPEERLIKLTHSISTDAIYLSGKGGIKYQDEELYAQAGLDFKYIDFTHPEYNQASAPFVPGLSTLDALFHLGVEATHKLLTDCQNSKP